ncbi:MAG: hypothetical protein OXG23_18210 [Chloroflexi bacterium]|nr:hypothetical protein [Chloroflexota bacterium]
MDQRSVFHDEWLSSLREQYKQVVRNDDRATLSSLTAVMQNVGFRDDELAQLRIEATMRVDDVPEGFSPDMDILAKTGLTQAHPAECACPECVTVDESKFDKEGQPIAPDPEADEYEAGQVFPVAEIVRSDDAEEVDSITFEDSLAAEAASAPDDAAESTADADESEADPDAPQQMNLF